MKTLAFLCIEKIIGNSKILISTINNKSLSNSSWLSNDNSNHLRLSLFNFHIWKEICAGTVRLKRKFYIHNAFRMYYNERDKNIICVSSTDNIEICYKFNLDGILLYIGSEYDYIDDINPISQDYILMLETYAQHRVGYQDKIIDNTLINHRYYSLEFFDLSEFEYRLSYNLEIKQILLLILISEIDFIYLNEAEKMIFDSLPSFIKEVAKYRIITSKFSVAYLRRLWYG